MFNSSSTLITLDFYQKYRPQASQKELVNAGRISTILLVLFSLLGYRSFKIMPFSNQLFLYLQSIQAYISPPIAAVFLLGIFIKRLKWAWGDGCSHIWFCDWFVAFSVRNVL